MNPIRVMIVDDQRLFAASLKTVLETVDSDLHVVGIATNGEEALASVDEWSPSLVLMDVRMPVLDGVETTRLLHFRHPEILIVMLTTFEDEEYVRSALSYGASGYLLKNIAPNELVASIRAVLSGAVSIDQRVLPTLIRAKDSGPSAPFTPQERENTDSSWAASLNRKEKQILGLMVQGFNNKEISVKLFIAEQTVRNYVSHIYEKIGVTDRVRAIIVARDSGLF